MIVDCHTHIWTSAEQLGTGAVESVRRESGADELAAGPAEHELASRCADKTLVLGYCIDHLGANVPNDLVAEYVAARDDRMIGIAATDPTAKSAVAAASEILDRKEFRGIAISPAGQDFHPADSRAMEIYELAATRAAPVFFHRGAPFATQGRMEYARPVLLDEIAGEFPDLPMVIASMGDPWIEEGIALIGKRPRVFADIAGLIRRPWQAYNALVLAHQFNVIDKVLFGSDFPFFTAAEAIEGLYRLNEITQGTNLPTVPREKLRSVVERDALEVLGIARPGETAPQDAVKEGQEDEP